jgi:hypothetical protein
MKKKTETKKKPEEKEEVKEEDEFWIDEDESEEPEEVDVSKIKFAKIKDLKFGMKDVNLDAVVDFIGESSGKGYGDEPFAPAFLKDETGEIKITFWGADIKKAKTKKKVRIINATITEFRGQLQISPDRKRGIEFI